MPQSCKINTPALLRPPLLEIAKLRPQDLLQVPQVLLGQHVNSGFLFPYSFFSDFWEFAILIAKQEMSHKEKLFPHLNSRCTCMKVLTFQTNGNADCVTFSGKAFLSHPLAFISICVSAHTHTHIRSSTQHAAHILYFSSLWLIPS